MDGRELVVDFIFTKKKLYIYIYINIMFVVS